MAKVSLSISRFDSGIVEGPNPRDIGDNAASMIEGLDPSTIGGLRPTGNIVYAEYPKLNNHDNNDEDNPGIVYTGLTNTNALSLDSAFEFGFGYGLYQFTSDYKNLMKHMSKEWSDSGSNYNVQDNNVLWTDASDDGSLDNRVYTILAGRIGGNASGEWSVGLFLHEYDPVEKSGSWALLGRDPHIGKYPMAMMKQEVWEGTLPIAFGEPRTIHHDLIPHSADMALWHPEGHTLNSDIDYLELYAEDFGIDKQYKPKFVNVNGYLRIYDERQKGFTYFLGYIQKGLQSNIRNHPSNWTTTSGGFWTPGVDNPSQGQMLNSGDGYVEYSNKQSYPQALKTDYKQDKPMQVDQWHFGISKLQQPRVNVVNLDWNNSTTDYDHSLAIKSEQHQFNQSSDNITDYILGNCINLLYQPSYEIANTGLTHIFRRISAHDFAISNSNMGMIHGTNSMGGQFPGLTFMTKMRFAKDINSDWPANGGPIDFYFSFMYDGTQETPLTKAEFPGGTDSAYYPSQYSGRLKMSVGISGASERIYTTGTSANTTHDLWTLGEPMRDIQGSALAQYPGLRCSGWKMYYAYQGVVETTDENDNPLIYDTETYLLWEMDFDKGYRISGDSEWRTLNYLNEFQHEWIEPPRMKTFATENAFLPSKNMDATYSTAVYHNQVMFAGDVTKNGIRYPDKILHSPVGMPDVFPDENFVDASGADGDPIRHLEASGSNLLVFKERKMLLLDITKLDEIKNTQTYHGYGVTNYRHVLNCPKGIVFVNPSGVFLFKGKDITNLLEEDNVRKISGEKWKIESNWLSNTLSDGQLDLGWDEENEKLIIALKVDTINSSSVHGNVTNNFPYGNKSGDTLQYHFRTKSWVFGRASMPNSTPITDDSQQPIGLHRSTQMIQDWQNRILIGACDSIYLENTGGTVTSYGGKMRFVNWKEHRDTGSSEEIIKNNLRLATKDFDFGQLGGKKSIKKIYITYSCPASADADTDSSLTGDAQLVNGTEIYSNIIVQFSVDGQSQTKYDFGTAKAKWVDKGTEAVKVDEVKLIPYNKYYGLLCTSEFEDDSIGGTAGTVSKHYDRRTIELRPENPQEAKKLNSFQLHLTNPNANVRKNKLNIDDITVIYRMHSTK